MFPERRRSTVTDEVHGERSWTTHRNCMYQGVSFEREEDAARTLGAVLSHNKVWQRHSDRWCLVAVPAGNLSEKNALGQQAQQL